MADLGTISTRNTIGNRLQKTAINGSVGGSALLSVPYGTLSGTVTVSGSAVAGANVMVSYRGALSTILNKTTASSGTFSFEQLDKSRSDYLIVATPPSGYSYNAIVFDKLTPV